jgi:hypothetical protein
MSLTGTMNDLHIAILRTFESTVKALMANGDNCNKVECVFDANTHNRADLGEICAELREIRTELTEMRTQFTQLEKCLEKKEKADTCYVGTKKVTNSIVNDIWPMDESGDYLFHRSLLSQMPIPLCCPEPIVTAAATTAATAATVATAAMTPEIRPRAQEMEEDIPDIHEEAEKEEEEEEEEEEEGTALDEFEYKGTTYYKDDDNLVYTLNDEGEVNDEPVGRWYEEKKIVKFFAKPAQGRT